MKKREIFLSDYKLSYPVEKIADPKDILFVDIETTGFTAKGSALYLIGCVWNNGKGYVITQFMADTYESENDVLSAFFTFSTSRSRSMALRSVSEECSAANSVILRSFFSSRISYR